MPVGFPLHVLPSFKIIGELDTRDIAFALNAPHAIPAQPRRLRWNYYHGSISSSNHLCKIRPVKEGLGSMG